MSGFHLDFKNGPHEGKVVSFEQDKIKIGRADDADLILREMGVSWAHAEIRQRDDAYWLVDSGSTNGTYVNDERAHNARLKEGDVLRFGKKAGAVIFGLGPGAADRSVDASDISKADTSAKLETKRHAAGKIAGGADVGLPTPGSLPAATAPKPAGVPAASRLARSDLPPVAQPQQASGSVLWPLAAAFLFVVCLGLGLYVVLFSADPTTLDDAERRADTAENELRTLQGAQRAQLDAARAEGRRLAEEDVAARLEQATRQLEREQRRAREAARDQEDTIEKLRRDLSRAQDQIRQLRTVGGTGGGDSNWKEIDEGLGRSVVLIMCQAEGIKRDTGKRVSLSGWGTGFFVSRRGDIITNKHVVQPWKYRKLVTKMAKEGIEVDASKTQIHVWIRGSKFRDDPKSHRPSIKEAYSTSNGTLELVRTTPDLWTRMTFKPDEAKIRSARVHKDVLKSDLALLRVIPKDGMRFAPIPVGDSRRVAALDEVMVLGFPAGPAVLEGVIAAASPVTGKVRKPESSILIGAPMIPGNSGGPLIDRDGRVVGVCAALQGSESLGYCIRIEHAMALLNGGKIK